jgi:hypothetical protein
MGGNWRPALADGISWVWEITAAESLNVEAL